MLNVIEFMGSREDLVWKSPIVDFNSLSQIDVNESQEAILYRDGKAYDLLPPGRHTLETANIPLFSKMFRGGTGEATPFRCEVYFVNKVEQMAIAWGTHSLNYVDAHYNNYAFPVSAFGELSLRVEDARKLVVKLVGTESILKLENVYGYFKNIIIAQVCSMLTTVMEEKEVDIFEVDKYQVSVATAMQDNIALELEDYGIALEKFVIKEIVKPEKDPVYKKIKALRGESATLETEGAIDIRKIEIGVQQDLIRHQGITQKGIMDINVRKYENEALGITEKDRLKLDVMMHMADNPGGGAMQNAMIGAGMGIGTMATMSHVIGNYAQDVFADELNPLGGGLNMGMPMESAPEMIHLKEEEEQEKTGGSTGMSGFQEKIDMLTYAKDVGAIAEEEYKSRLQKLFEDCGI